MKKMEEQDLSVIVEPLLEWYKREKRDLPWRRAPSFYHVWLSEVMLQQTRVEAVKEYYQRFLRELPTIFALANAKEEQLLKLWEGLGYYNRVRNLQKGAKQVVDFYHGEVPKTYRELLTLSGIGPYTAGAIASICFNEKVPAVDGNVLRVITRITDDFSDIAKSSTKKKIEKKLQVILPAQVGDFNQALMELGAMICLPNGKPLCAKCPVFQYCQSFHANHVMSLPVKKKKQPRTILKYTVFLCIHDHEIAIQKREEKGVLANLWGFPMQAGWISRAEVIHWANEQGLEPVRVIPVDSVRHVFTHLEWHMKGYLLLRCHKSGEFTWTSISEQNQKYALPSAYKKYFQIAKERMHK